MIDISPISWIASGVTVVLGTITYILVRKYKKKQLSLKASE